MKKIQLNKNSAARKQPFGQQFSTYQQSCVILLGISQKEKESDLAVPPWHLPKNNTQSWFHS